MAPKCAKRPITFGGKIFVASSFNCQREAGACSHVHMNVALENSNKMETAKMECLELEFQECSVRFCGIPSAESEGIDNDGVFSLMQAKQVAKQLSEDFAVLSFASKHERLGPGVRIFDLEAGQKDQVTSYLRRAGGTVETVEPACITDVRLAYMALELMICLFTDRRVHL